MMPELFGNQAGGNVEVSEQVAEHELYPPIQSEFVWQGPWIQTTFQILIKT